MNENDKPYWGQIGYIIQNDVSNVYNDAVVMLTAVLLMVALLVVMTMTRTMIDNGGLYDANDDEPCDCDGGDAPMIVMLIINGDCDGDDVDHDVDYVDDGSQ